MVLDGLTLFSSVRELRPQILDSKVTKINMPTKEEVTLQLFTRENGNLRLNIVMAADSSAVFSGDMKKPNPKTPPAFCMLLRKYLSNARIKDVVCETMDRTFELVFESKDEMLHPVNVSLVCELMGKYSNIILLNSERKIMDAAKRISVDVSSLRQVLPGARYTLPPLQQKNINETDENELEKMFESDGSETPLHFLPRTFAGFSAKAAEEIISRSGFSDIPFGQADRGDRKRFARAIKIFFREALANPAPCVQMNADGLPVFVSCIPFDTYPKDLRKSFDSMNDALFFYYSKRREIFSLRQKKDAIKKLLSKSLSKTEKKIKTLEEGIEDSKKAPAITARANLITANIYRLKKGMTGFEACDPETGETVRVPLDISLHPAQNAQKLYRRAAKMKMTNEIWSERLEKAIGEKEFIESSILFTEKAESAEDLFEIEGILSDENVISAPRAKKTEISQPRKYISPSGYTVYVGRNDRQNDRLTMGMAKKHDIWFHAQKMPGAHVLLVTDGKPIEEIDDATIEYAASLAAAYSSAKLGGKIPVDYTYRSNIKKPPASRPGRVIYEHYWTIYTEKEI